MSGQVLDKDKTTIVTAARRVVRLYHGVGTV